jgi:hypothetical protein
LCGWDGEGMFCEDGGVEFGDICWRWDRGTGSWYGSRIRRAFAYALITYRQSILPSVMAEDSWQNDGMGMGTGKKPSDKGGKGDIQKQRKQASSWVS